MKKLLLVFLLANILHAQGTYYDNIDTSNASFVTDLHNLIYPHTRITYDQYDETNVADFASRDTIDGQKVVTCVYSGENYVYTPPFTWTVYSREHTWCQSWMPSNHASGFTSRPEYSDQHHIFPVDQNKANGIRSNHPEGVVITASYTYLLCKLGTDSRGATVFEPRESHKGDYARALMYMAVCYNDINGYDWTFNNLNRVLVDSLSEASQDVNLLFQWHEQDPPDHWEKDRNEYVYSIQGNRNPFIDHPEYADVIDFNTLTKKTATVLASEPTNYPNGFDTPTLTSSSVDIKWTDPAGTILPSGYLLKASATNSFTDPADGTTYIDDTSLADGSAQINVVYGTQHYTFTGLTASTMYYFKLFPYNGSSGSRNYKTTDFPGSLNTGYSTSTANSGGGISISSLTFTYSQNFNTLANSGTGNTWTNNVTITGWYSNKSVYDAATGSSNTGKLYSFGSSSSSERALGSVASGTTGKIYYGVRFTNNSGTTITTILVSYTGEQWRNGGNTTVQKLTFENKVNADSLTDPTGWIAVPALDFSSPIATATAAALDGNASANKIAVSSTISLSLNNGSDIWFRWADQDDSGNDHGLAIDDFNLENAGSLMPIELTSFNASILLGSVALHWQTATEVNNYGFEVERRAVISHQLSVNSEQWTRVGFVKGKGTSTAPKEYSFKDGKLLAGRYEYRLKQVDLNGSFKYSQSVEIEIAIPKEFALEQNYPNPFNPTTVISYQLPIASNVTLKVYSILGKEVATLVNEVKEAGSYMAQFNASHLSSGVYFFKLITNQFSSIRKMTLLR